MKCKECGQQTVRGQHHGHAWGPWRKYCSDKCRAIQASRTIKKVNKKYQKELSVFRSKRMAEKNPMYIPGVKERSMATNKALGTHPLVRGGNGKEMAIPQRVLLTALGMGWYAEHVVVTNKKQGLPNSYKIDIAHPKRMIAIEVDGGSHGALIRQIQDRKKENFLISVGWRVLRFKNKEVMDCLSDVLLKIK